MATLGLNDIPYEVRAAVAPGLYMDEQLVPIHDELLEGLECWLRDAVTSLHRRDAVLAAAEHVAVSLLPLQRAFLASDFVKFANLRPEVTTPVGGARYLLEMVISYAGGTFPASAKKLAELDVAAQALVLLSNLKTWRITGAQRLSLVVDDCGRMTIGWETAAFDLQAYELCERRYNLTSSMHPAYKVLFRWLNHKGESIRDHPWAVADNAFRNEYGCSLRTFMRTMATLASHPLPARRRIAVVRDADLVDEVMESFPVPDAMEVRQAINALTADRNEIRENLRAWQQRERSARLMTTPLFDPARSGRLVIVPALALLAMNVHVEYLRVGTWPGPEGSREMMTPFRQALKDIEFGFNLAFERKVAVKFQGLGFITRTQVRDLPELAIKGDIDVLAVHVQRRQIWIVEVKDPITPHSPPQFASQVKNFKEWSRKHLARVQTVESLAGKAAVGRIFQIPNAETFDVRSIIVTRRPSPTSFRDDMPERVTWLDALPSILEE